MCVCVSLFFIYMVTCGSMSSSSAVDQPCLVHMLPGIGRCGAGLLLFPTACWWLTHPAAITGVSVSAGWDSPGGCGGLFCFFAIAECRVYDANSLQVHSQATVCAVHNLNIVVCSCLARWLIGSKVDLCNQLCSACWPLSFHLFVLSCVAKSLNVDVTFKLFNQIPSYLPCL